MTNYTVIYLIKNVLLSQFALTMIHLLLQQLLIRTPI